MAIRVLIIVMAGALSGCSMYQLGSLLDRRDCSIVARSQGAQCPHPPRMAEAEYNAERKALRQSLLEPAPSSGEDNAEIEDVVPVDARYKSGTS